MTQQGGRNPDDSFWARPADGEGGIGDPGAAAPSSAGSSPAGSSPSGPTPSGSSPAVPPAAPPTGPTASVSRPAEPEHPVPVQPTEPGPWAVGQVPPNQIPRAQPSDPYGSPEPTAQHGYPSDAAAQANQPPQGYPPAGHPEAGYPQDGYQQAPFGQGQQYQQGPFTQNPYPQAPYQGAPNWQAPPRRRRGNGCLWSIVISILATVLLNMCAQRALTGINLPEPESQTPHQVVLTVTTTVPADVNWSVGGSSGMVTTAKAYTRTVSTTGRQVVSLSVQPAASSPTAKVGCSITVDGQEVDNDSKQGGQPLASCTGTTE